MRSTAYRPLGEPTSDDTRIPRRNDDVTVCASRTFIVGAALQKKGSFTFHVLGLM